jgi:pimeloyl-ACP methyl ester carboxylesterase
MQGVSRSQLREYADAFRHRGLWLAGGVSPPNRILLVAGPPFSKALYAPVVARLAQTLPDVDVSTTAAGEKWPDQESLGRTVVVAHGLALPWAIQEAVARPPALLVLSNGPVSRLDAVSRTVRGLASTAGSATLFQYVGLSPRIWLMALRSSLALRRTVNNPYAMDRDTVAAICGPLVESAAARAKLRESIVGLPLGPRPLAALRCPVLAIWGDNDVLYPKFELDLLTTSLPKAAVVVVPGGRFLHPIEQPWSFADALLSVFSPPAMATPSERPAGGMQGTPTTMSRTSPGRTSAASADSPTIGVVR